MIKRLFDIIFSFLGLIILSPFFFLFSLLIIVGNGFPVFYLQSRVGKKGKDFFIFKFRTMKKNAETKGSITIGTRDERITHIGYFLRKFKMDELPQLFNVLIGNMSLVGPRPEVRKYVNMYTEEQLKVLSVKPGITDLASIEYSNENEVLGKANDPEETYVKEIMPKKLMLNLKYIQERSFGGDLKIIFKTIEKILR